MNNPTKLHSPRWLLIILALSVGAIHAMAGGTAFSKLVVFGDSLNDTGNLTRLTGGVFPNAPTYTYGRQTNGPVWVEYLAHDLGLANKILNYAVVGAMTKPAPGFPTGNVWSDTYSGLEGTDVASQVKEYGIDSHERADPCALFILEGGANDFPRVQDPSVIVANLIDSLIALEKMGARHILVVNLPDIGKTPRVILAERLGYVPPGSGAFYSGACAQLNQALAGAVAQVTPQSVTITFADTYGFMNKVEANPAAYNIFEAQMPWLMFGAGTDPVEWFFWDDLHPTTRGYEIFADQVVDELIRVYRTRHSNGFGQGDFPCRRHH